jgi:NADH dehydrogenase
MVYYEKVVIVGGGFGGLTAAQHLGNTSLEVQLIDQTNHYLFQPLLYQVAGAALAPSDIATPIREILSRQSNTYVIMGEVIAIDKTKKKLILENEECPSCYSFDYLILAVGTQQDYFGKEEWKQYTTGIKTLADAIEMREKILLSFENAERSDKFSEAEKYLTFVIVGGGATGVELAGAIAEIAYKTMIKDFRKINIHKTKIYLIESSPHILSSFPEDLARRATNDLKHLGVHILTGSKVTHIDAEGVQVNNSLFIPAKNIFWAAGNKAPELLKTLDTPLDAQGRVLVDVDLSLPDCPEIFVIGDAAATKSNGKNVPQLATAAIQEGAYVSEIIRKRIHKEKRSPFTFRDRGTIATIGKSKAVGTIGAYKLSGFMGWAAWSLIHVAYLIGFRNRLIVMIKWMMWYFTENRGARLISHLKRKL